MNNAKTFLKVKRRELALRPEAERVNDYKDVFASFAPGHSAGQASRCMDCGTPFCHWGCPAGNHIPEWNALMGSGSWMDAYKLLSSTNNFPEFTGRLCPAICEHSCVLGINDEPVAIRENELALTEYAFRRGIEASRPARTGRKAAVIGSGPAGLAAADELNKAGHSVTVYEKQDKIGGMLRYGIPDFKLEKNILDRRIRMMEEAGIRFITGAECGKNPPMARLRAEYDALCIAGGCESARDLPVPGRELSGIHFAMEYLTMTNKKIAGEITAAGSCIDSKGKKVVVIGGGDTGSDCVGTAHRQKAASITQIEILPRPPRARTGRQPWPRYADILKNTSSHREGGTRMWNVMTKRFIGEKGKLKKILCVNTRTENKGGILKIEEIPKTEFELDADTALIAVGFSGPDKKGVIESSELELDAKGCVRTDSSFMTSQKNIFSAGDMRRGQSLVIHAIVDGRECARHMDLTLRKAKN